MAVPIPAERSLNALAVVAARRAGTAADGPAYAPVDRGTAVGETRILAAVAGGAADHRATHLTALGGDDTVSLPGDPAGWRAGVAAAAVTALDQAGSAAAAVPVAVTTAATVVVPEATDANAATCDGFPSAKEREEGDDTTCQESHGPATGGSLVGYDSNDLIETTAGHAPSFRAGSTRRRRQQARPETSKGTG